MAADSTPDLHDQDARETTKFVVGEPEHPIIELSQVDLPADIQLQPLQVNQDIANSLSRILSLVPGAIASGAQALTKTYMLQFGPEVAAQLGSGTATLMQSLNGGVRAIAVDSSGRIVGGGRLVAATGLSTITTATLLWQTLAMITAQHYLHDMQRQLNSISIALSELKSWLLLKEQAALLGHERYLRRITDLIQRGAVSELDIDSISHQIEQIDLESDQVQEMMRLIMERQHERVRRAPISGWYYWDVQRNVMAAQEYVEDFNRAASIYGAAVRVKGMLAAFRTQLFLQVQTSDMRLEEAAQDSQRGRKKVILLYEVISSRLKEVQARACYALWPLSVVDSRDDTKTLSE